MKPGITTTNLTADFADALVRALSSLTGAAFRVVAAPSTPPPTDLLVWQQELRPLESTGLLFSAGADLWMEAGRLMLATAGVDEATPEDCRGAWHEIAGQTMGSLTSSLSVELGRDVMLGHGTEVPAVPETNWKLVGIEGPGGSYCAGLWWPEPLVAVASPPPAADFPAGNSRTLDLLLDVALPVAVSFGRTSLQIREVLKLNTGSVIELNRLIQEPVDIIINDSVIARGEVVVVDGNYGVRITHLASREDRIRTGVASAESIRTGATA